ncbi:MAG: hypothetical protein KTR17_09150 [Cellvibrionaceae bacterium]|nr:hypothetical protein [Cellvibrionaceae bacterium]
MKTLSCRETWLAMTRLSAAGDQRNYTQTIAMDDYLVETELFPKPVLEAYSCWNLGQPLKPQQQAYFNSERGGGQGDYREGMPEKIANVVDCLRHYPASKRALITIANQPIPDHRSDEQAKCFREIHFHLAKEPGRSILNATCFFRAQAALIFPKNIHFIGSLMHSIGQQLPQQPQLGQLFYLTSLLVADRT